MVPEDSQFWIKARQAQEKLVDRFLGHPAVSLIDIGYTLNPEGEGEDVMERLVLRVHVRQSGMREVLDLPAEVDGIPVEVVVADYRLE